MSFYLSEAAKIEQHAAEAVVHMIVHADHDVFQQGHFLEHADVLERTGDTALGDLVRRDLADVLAVEFDRAAGSAQQTGDQVEDGGLAGAVRADQAKDAALRDIEIDVLQNLQAAKVLADVFELQHYLLPPACALRRKNARIRRGSQMPFGRYRITSTRIKPLTTDR